MMKRLFFGLLTVLTFAACSSDPVYHGMTPQQEEDYSKAIAGEYTGTYVILYNDGGGDDKAVKIKNSQMTITDQKMHSVCFHDYPVSQLSSVVTDSALAEALATAPNVDFLADYHFYDMQDNGDVNMQYQLISGTVNANVFITLFHNSKRAMVRITGSVPITIQGDILPYRDKDHR